MSARSSAATTPASAPPESPAPAPTSPAAPDLPFWKTTALEDMTPEQWESLCDGCGKCCLHKLQEEHDDGTLGEIEHTNVGCRLLDVGTGKCTRYETRWKYVPDCVQLFPQVIGRHPWLPPTCAYRLVYEGKDLPWWHPLVSGDPETVHEAGVSVRGRAISERQADILEHHIVDWPDL